MTDRARERRLVAVALAVVAVGALLAVPGALNSSLSPLGPAHSAPALTPSAPRAAATATGLALPSHPAPPSPPPSSGRGLFFNNTAIPAPSNTTSECSYLPVNFYYGTTTCMNNTDAPSLVATSTGALAVAYTALTNATACAGSGNYTLSEVGFTLSTDAGATFGAPQYLDNPGCYEPQNYTSAADPSLASLANGTLVLAYLQYNISQTSYMFYPPPCQASEYNDWPALGPCGTTFDRLVVQESYDNGTTWTSPVVINGTMNNSALSLTGWPMPAEPTLAAYGNTVYLAWVNLTEPTYFYPYQGNFYPSTGLNLVTSTNGGTTWSAPVSLPVQSESLPMGGSSWVADDPSLTVNATGTLFVAYDTAFAGDLNQVCQPTGCAYPYPEATVNVVVATTSNLGASFNVSTVASDVLLNPEHGGFTWGQGYWYDTAGNDPRILPQTAITTDPATGEVYVAYSGGQVGTICYLPGSCYTTTEFENVWVANSTDGGANWSTSVALGDSVLGVYGSATDIAEMYNPSITVGSNGDVYVDVQFFNASGYNIYYDYPYTDYLYVSTDQAASFGGPLSVPAQTPYAYYTLSDGFDTSMVTYGGQPVFAWTLQVCPGMGALGYCGALSNNFAYSQVVVSSIYNLTGITVSFSETGIGPQYNWSIALGGNVREGPGGSNLTVSGVPVNVTEGWVIPPVNPNTYGVLFQSNVSGGNSTFNASANSVSVTFSEYVLFTLSTVPSGSTYFPFSCQNALFGDYCANTALSPPTGSTWLLENTSIAYSEYPIAFPSYCYSCYNVSFQAWTGTGDGSWNTTVPNGTAILLGPVNETASYSFLSSCQVMNGAPACANVTYPYVFHESGLPAGTLWGVTLGNTSAFTNASTEVLQGAFGPLNYTAWTIPGANASWSWIGTPDVSSPATTVQASNITITYRLAPNTQPFDVQWQASGLPPSATGWGLSIGGTEYGVPLAGETLSVMGGSPGVTLNASDVYGNAGIGAYLTGFEVSPDAVGVGPYHVAPGGVLSLDGPATITAQFSPLYWLSIPTPTNGTVNGTSAWLPANTPVTLGATADPGYYFVGWTGSGTGSKSTSATSVSFTMGGPVTETATFASVPLVYTLTVEESGLPSTQPFTLYLGNHGYTGVGPFEIPNLAPGTYNVSAPNLSPNATYGTEYLETGIASPLSPSAGTLDVTANGTVTVSFGTDYLLTINPTTNGSTNPGAGSVWVPAGVPQTITATPANASYVFTGWNGTGMGSSNATTSTIQVSLSGPVSETALFALYVPPPARTYSLELSPTGLPASVTWSAWIGGDVETGTGPLTFAGLNGTVTVGIGTVTPSAGTEYVPANTSVTLTIATDQNRTVAFATDFEVTVTATTGGTATPSTEWVASGSSVTLTATAATGYQFVNWTGTAYAGVTAAPTFTVNGPVSETANFAPIPSSSSSSGSGSLTVPIVALVVLLVAGLVIGLVIARARKPRGPASAGAPAATAAPTSGAPPPPPAPWSEGPAPTPAADEEEHIYGGGSG